MKAFLQQLRGALAATLVMAVVCGGAYPLLVFGLAQVLFPDKANGSLCLATNGMVLGSRLIGQSFSGEGYFHSRPSAAGSGYDATSSAGSNLGPTSKKLHDVLKQRIAVYRRLNALDPSEAVPADAVTASGSGLDPHISVRNAVAQSPRVARARGLQIEVVGRLIQQNTIGRGLGFLGEEGVNVLTLNLMLDSLDGARKR